MAHVNPNRPNILQDKLARANIHRHNGRYGIDRYGNPMAIFDTLRNLKPRRDYRHCEDAQILQAETGN
jgi:hypothetical protein